MDPVNRALWWRRDRAGGDGPDALVHELARVLRTALTGRPVVDWSDAGTWATYDVATGGWSAARIAETGIEARWLPDVQPNATPIGTDPASRSLPQLGLPPDLWWSQAPTTRMPRGGLGRGRPGGGRRSRAARGTRCNMAVGAGLASGPRASRAERLPASRPYGFGILSTDPNGMSIMDWARDLTRLSIADLDAGLGGERARVPGTSSADAAFTPLPHRSASRRYRRDIPGRDAGEHSRRPGAGAAGGHRHPVRALAGAAGAATASRPGSSVRPVAARDRRGGSS